MWLYWCRETPEMLTAKVHGIFKGPLAIRRDIALSKVSRMYTGGRSVVELVLS